MANKFLYVNDATDALGDSDLDVQAISASALFHPSKLGNGTRNGTKFLRDDGTWQAASGSGGGLTAAQAGARAMGKL